MKKAVSLMLAVAMLLGCVACTSEETTKKKKKKTSKKTSETEDTETEPTDEPTDEPTSEPTDPGVTGTTPSSTDDTSVTGSRPGPSGSHEWEISDDGEYLTLLRETFCYQYGEMDPNEDNPMWKDIAKFVRTACDTYTIVNGPQQITSDFEYLYQTILDNITSSYDERISAFLEAKGNGEALPFYNYRFETTVYRADDQMLSFSIRGLIDSSQADEIDDLELIINLDPQLSESLTIEDIITDEDALMDYIEEYFDALYLPEVAEYAEELWDQDEEFFGVTYDGIIIRGHKLPVYGHEECFNMYYFGKTPSDYILRFEDNGDLVWDIDGDNVFDTIHAGSGNGELSIQINDQTYVFTDDDITDVSNLYKLSSRSPSVLIRREGKTFMILSMYVYNQIVELLTFDLSSGKPEFVYDMTGRLGETLLNPNAFDILELVPVLGSAAEMRREYEIQTTGKLLPHTAFGYYETLPLVVMSDISGEQFDWDSGDMIGSYTISSGAIVSACAYGPNNGTLVFKVLDADRNNEIKYVMVKYNKDTDTIDGKAFNEVFGQQLEDTYDD